MKSLIHSHPRAAPFAAAAIALVGYLAVSWPLREQTYSKIGQAIVVAVVVFLVIRSLSRTRVDRDTTA
ncbi:MAG TPA: hypothetical protein VEB19_15065 [Gemmatimonadaceae bacterium]|nr:hypothetical protein [Gemmatimonadaceae bacterium]